MKKLGTVRNVIHDGTILLGMDAGPTPETPAQGTTLFDQRGDEVGRVARVFGPVGSPYVSVRKKPDVEPMGLLGTSLYLDPEQKPVPRAKTSSGRKTFVKRGRPQSGSTSKKGVKEYRRKERPRKR
jgi:rRNA processing protein Gar1